MTHFAKGLGAARSGDVAPAKQEVAALEKIVADLTARKDAYWPIVVDAQRMAVSAWPSSITRSRHRRGKCRSK